MSSILLLFFCRKFITKNFEKGTDKTGHGFKYVRNKFPNVSDTKIKVGIFIGPQIRELMQDKQFDEDLNKTERNAWLSFKRIWKDFLGNYKAANYQTRRPSINNTVLHRDRVIHEKIRDERECINTTETGVHLCRRYCAVTRT